MEVRFLEEQIQYQNHPTFLRNITMLWHQSIWYPPLDNENDIELRIVMDDILSDNEGRMVKLNVIQLREELERLNHSPNQVTNRKSTG